MRTKGAALFIRCSEEESQKIRKAVKAERRTVSGFILNAVINRIEAREKMLQQDTARTLRRSSTSSSS